MKKPGYCNAVGQEDRTTEDTALTTRVIRSEPMAVLSALTPMLTTSLRVYTGKSYSQNLT